MSARLLRGMGLGLLVAAPGAVHADGLPKGFVYLADVDATIAQEMRYFGAHNFLGRPVEGYQAGECILTEAAARALSNAQDALAPHGFGLKVYDCYRPGRAVRDFVDWSKEAGSEAGKAYFYSTIPKNRLFALGYIATRSNHSAGSTVDLGLVRLAQENDASAPALTDVASTDATQTSSVASKAMTCYTRAPGNSGVDMGTDFDCFHPRSAFAADGISSEAHKNRDLLRGTMEDAGFEPYETEWWHFTLRNEPFPKHVFDFPVTARDAQVGR
jgi:D-alanyl-D-alanine dipeptidase